MPPLRESREGGRLCSADDMRDCGRERSTELPREPGREPSREAWRLPSKEGARELAREPGRLPDARSTDPARDAAVELVTDEARELAVGRAA